MHGVVVEVRGRKWDGRNRVGRRKRERESMKEDVRGGRRRLIMAGEW